MNHRHKEPTSPNEKKPKTNTEVVEISSEVVKNILTEVFNIITKDEEMENKNKTAIEPTKDFLTNTAVTLAEMLDDLADQIEETDEGEVDETEELEDRLDILRGEKPRNKKVANDDVENTLVTLPLKDVEELRQKLRNLEGINENLSLKLKDTEELKSKKLQLESINQKLIDKLKQLEEKNIHKKKEPKKNKGQARDYCNRN